MVTVSVPEAVGPPPAPPQAEAPALAAGQRWQHNDCGVVVTIRHVDGAGDGCIGGSSIQCKHGGHGYVFTKERAERYPELSNWSFVSGPGQAAPAPSPSPSPPAIVVADRRQVSHDGYTWLDYEKLTDPDAFDAYKHRRVWRGGKVVEEHGGYVHARADEHDFSDRYAVGRKMAGGPLLQACSKCGAIDPGSGGVVAACGGRPDWRERHERQVSESMQLRDMQRAIYASADPGPTRPFRQAHLLEAGVGVWSLRDES